MKEVDFIQAILQYGPLGIVLVAIMFRWLVPGWAYERERLRADEWQKLALSSTALADRSTGMAADTVGVIKRMSALEEEVEGLLRERKKGTR